jgi:hypothetical protein
MNKLFPIVEAQVVTTTTATVVLDKRVLEDFIKANLKTQERHDFRILGLSVNVPGGGDYSNMNLEIEDDTVVTAKVSWTETN